MSPFSAERWTKMSSPPSRAINPNPFSGSYHLTVPLATTKLRVFFSGQTPVPPRLYRRRRGGKTSADQGPGWTNSEIVYQESCTRATQTINAKRRHRVLFAPVPGSSFRFVERRDSHQQHP